MIYFLNAHFAVIAITKLDNLKLQCILVVWVKLMLVRALVRFLYHFSVAAVAILDSCWLNWHWLDEWRVRTLSTIASWVNLLLLESSLWLCTRYSTLRSHPTSYRTWHVYSWTYSTIVILSISCLGIGIEGKHQVIYTAINALIHHSHSITKVRSLLWDIQHLLFLIIRWFDFLDARSLTWNSFEVIIFRKAFVQVNSIFINFFYFKENL